jgi:predicted ester cyclase
MSVEENKALYRRWIEEGWNSGDAAKAAAAVDKFFSPGYFDHGVPPGFPRTIEAPKRAVGMYIGAFAGLQVHIEHLVAEGDMVVAHVRFMGTHQGRFAGAEPSGKEISFPAFDMVQIVDGKIVDHWFVGEFLGMMRQIGALP